jgi:hypothetical protein
MKLIRCPQCGAVAPLVHYAEDFQAGTLRCYDCSTPGHPVYVLEVRTGEASMRMPTTRAEKAKNRS